MILELRVSDKVRTMEKTRFLPRRSARKGNVSIVEMLVECWSKKRPQSVQSPQGDFLGFLKKMISDYEGSTGSPHDGAMQGEPQNNAQ